MKPAAFGYHSPQGLAEALDLLAEYGDEAKPLAGGQSLVPMLAVRLAPVRATEAEAALVGRSAGGGSMRLNEAAIGSLALAGADPTDDTHASALYRRRVGAVIVARTVAEAARRAATQSREGRDG